MEVPSSENESKYDRHLGSETIYLKCRNIGNRIKILRNFLGILDMCIVLQLHTHRFQQVSVIYLIYFYKIS